MTIFSIVVLSVFFLLNQEIESHSHYKTPHLKSRSGKQLFKNDFKFSSHGEDIRFPPIENVCAPHFSSGSQQPTSLCLPIHRCLQTVAVNKLPKICGWSGLLPDVCCPLSPSRNDSIDTDVPRPLFNQSQEFPKDENETTDRDPAPSAVSRGTGTWTEETVAGTTAHPQLVPQTMTSKTSATKESISSITIPPELTTAIKWTDVTASATERPFTALTSIAGSDKRSTASTLTSTAESLAWSTGGPAVGSSAMQPTKSVPGGEVMKQATPMPVIAYKNSANCGLSDEKTVWPFVVSCC